MEYLKKYDMSDKQIQELKDKYNDRIINFFKEQKEFIIEKLKYLNEREYFIYPILSNNIKVFLEEMKPLQKKIEKMEHNGYSKKAIQMVLINEQLYNEV